MDVLKITTVPQNAFSENQDSSILITLVTTGTLLMALCWSEGENGR